MKIVLKYITVFFLLSSCALPQFSLKPAGKVAQKEIPAKSIQIDFFENTSPLSSAIVSSLFTESLRDLMQAQTSLDLVANNGDVIFSGAIKEYKISPVNIQAGTETAAQNRLTMAVMVSYENVLNEEDNIEKRFSFYYDFPGNLQVYDIKDAALEEIFERITQDILNETLAKW